MKLNIIACTMGVLRFAWETFVLLNNLKERNLSDKAHILVWIPHSELNHPLPDLWRRIEREFPESRIVYFRDELNFQNFGGTYGYVQLFRIRLMADYFNANPHLEQEAIFYCDTDILITKDINWDKYLEGDTCYLSDTNSYINATYFQSKYDVNEDLSPRFVRKDRWADFKKRDVLAECASFAGITKDVCIKNDNCSGGAQYLMKGITAEWWEYVLDSCLNIKVHLANVNQEFMQGSTPKDREDTGYQSWCADMWAVLWNLWRIGKETKTPREFDFMWATDEIKDKKYTFIFHNAGVTEENTIRTTKKDEKGNSYFIDAPAFYKGAPQFIEKTPFEFENDLDTILSHPTSAEFGTSIYAAELKKVKHLYNL